MLLSFLNDDYQLDDESSQDLTLISERSDLTQNNNICDYSVIHATEQIIRYSLNHLCNTNFQPINYEYDYPNIQGSEYIEEGNNEELYIDTEDIKIRPSQLACINIENDTEISQVISQNYQLNPLKNEFENNYLEISIYNHNQNQNRATCFKNGNGKREHREISIGNSPTQFEIEMVAKGYSNCMVMNGDKYSPHWIIYRNGDKEGLCQICFDDGVEETFKLKSSSYWYHMNYFHGISSKTKDFYPNPIEYSHYKRPMTKSQKSLKNFNPRVLSKGLCGNCNTWIDLDSKKVCPIKSPNIYWWKHCQKCLLSKKEKMSAYNRASF